jgi:hypothetical protein
MGSYPMSMRVPSLRLSHFEVEHDQWLGLGDCDNPKRATTEASMIGDRVRIRAGLHSLGVLDNGLQFEGLTPSSIMSGPRRG